MPALWDDPPADGRRPPGRVTSPVRAGAARFEVLVPPPADGSTRARLGRLELPHGVVETPQFMPVGTNATVKALHPDEVEAAGATIVLANTYHLYLRPGHERIRARRPQRVHGLGPPDPHGLGRLPGREPRRPAGHRRRRGDVQEPSRRDDPPVHAGALDRGPAGPRPGRRGRLRPAGLPELAAGGRRRCDAADPSLGGAVPRGPHPHGPGAVRRRAGRAGPGASRGVGAVHRVAAVRRDQHRRPRRRRDPRGAQRDARPHDPVPRRRPAAALPDGPGLAAGPPRRRPPGRRPVQFRAPGAGRAQRPAMGAGRAPEPPEHALSRRSEARPGGLPVPALHPVFEGLSGPSVPGPGDARVPARDLSQPHLHPRLHAQDPRRFARRNVPRRACRAALPRRQHQSNRSTPRWTASSRSSGEPRPIR